MYASEHLTSAAQRWRTAADALLLEAERIGPLEDGVFGELGTDDEGMAAAQRIDEQVETLLREGDEVFTELEIRALDSSDARFQTTSLLVGALAVAEALSVAGQSPSDVFGELSVESGQTGIFADARSTVSEANALVAVPSSLEESLEKIEAAGATESWKVLSGSAGKLAAGALLKGLDVVLTGSAAAAFDFVKGYLGRWRDALKRGVVQIAKWVVDKVQSLLPEAMADKVDDLFKFLQEKLEPKLGNIATDLYGGMLGRAETEKAWLNAAAAGKDLSEAENKLGAVTAAHIARIAWVTKGRKIIDKFDTIASGVVAVLPPPALIAFAALVAAVLVFVAVQVWDGFNDIEALI